MGYLHFLTKSGAKATKAIEAEIAQLQTVKQKRIADLSRTQAALASAQADVQALLMREDIDEGAIRRAEEPRVAHEKRVDDLRITLDAIDAQIKAKQDELDAIVTKALAETLASGHEADIAAMRKTMDAFVTASRDLAAIAGKVGESSFPAREIAELANNLSREFPIAQEHIEAELSFTITSLRNGSIKPKLPTPVAAPAPVTQEKKPEIERRRVYTTAAIAWLDEGEVKTRGKHERVALPTAIAVKAINLGYALDEGDDRVKQLVARYGGQKMTSPPAGASGVVDLNSESLAPAQAVFGRDIHAVDAGLRETIKG